METKILKKYKLIDTINPESIHSIIPVKDCYGGISLAIALKGGGVQFISLDHFTYHPYMWAAIPQDLYSSIIVMEKSNENSDRFLKCRITKPVKF